MTVEGAFILGSIGIIIIKLKSLKKTVKIPLFPIFELGSGVISPSLCVHVVLGGSRVCKAPAGL